MNRQSKKSLNNVTAGCYIFPAVTVLTVGHLTPGNTRATTDAISVFFIVATNATDPFYVVMHIIIAVFKFMQAWSISGASHHRVMVALAGLTSVRPGSFVSGSEIPVRAIASEHLTSCDGNMLFTKETAIMATYPTKKHPKSAIPQLSYDCRRKIQRAQDFAFWLYMYHYKESMEIAPHVIHAFSYIADDIECIDKELIALGLFDEAMGKRRK
ncbi:ash family protein [Citrobacter meridianamericanus]|uniref:ash family protein n=1 Tax=Citrobacter meridianamericanus TaxID=2894201 RepID=UPI00351D33BC